MSATDLTVKVGADLTGFKYALAAMPGIAKPVAVSIAAAFAAAATAIGVAIKVGAKFEQTLTETATVAQAFGKDLKALEDKARELGRTTAFTATEAAKGMYDLASAGLTTREIVDSVEYAMKLAGATGSEMSQATGVLSSTLKQFGLDASESKRITDTFAAAITGSKLTMERLTEGMKDAGNAGGSLGWSIEETTAALAQFVNIGLEGSRAGTNLKMAMVQLIKQTDTMKEALREMGLTYKDINPETHNFGEIIKTLGERSMTTGQAIAIFGGRVSLAMKTLVERSKAGKVNFEEFLQTLIKSQEGVGRTTEMYDRMMNTFQGKWIILKSAISELFISFFDTFKESGRDLFETWTDGVNDLAQFIRDNGTQITSFFDDLATVINAAAKTALFFAENTGLLIIKLSELKDQTVDGVEKTGQAFKESLEEYPKFVKNLIMAWYELADELKKKDLATFFKEQFLESNKGITKAIENTEAANAALKQINPTYYATIDALKELGNQVDDTYSDWEATSKKTTDNVNDDINEFVKNLIEGVEKTEKLDEVISKVFSDIDDAQKRLLEENKRTIREVDDALEKFFHEVELMVKETYEYEAAVKAGIAVQNELYDMDFGHWYDGMSKATEMWGKFSQGATDALETARSGFMTLEQAGKQMMESFIDSYRTMWGDTFYDVMTGQFDDISDAFSTFFDSILKNFTDMLGEMVANDILKGGLSNVLKVGAYGAAGYLGAQALGGNQVSQNLAATGAMVGAQYYGGWGALAGAAVGYLAGNLLGTGTDGKYETRTSGAYLGATVDKSDLTFSFDQLKKQRAWGDDLSYQMAAALNKATDTIGSTLATALNSIPIEMRKTLVNQQKYINSDLVNLGFGNYYGSTTDTAKYKQTHEDLIKRLEENAQSYLDSVAQSMGQTTWEAFEKYMYKFETAAQSSAQLIGESFKAALDSGAYTFDAFKNNLYDAIYNTVKDGMINALLQSEAFRAALNPFFMQFQNAIEQSTIQGIVDPMRLANNIDKLNTAQLISNINALEPVLNVLSLVINDLGNQIYGRASGGPVKRGTPYIVGENNPELFVPDSDGYVYPDTDKYGAMADSAKSIVFINQGVMTESEFFAKSMRQYQDYKQGDKLQTIDVSVQGLRLG